MREIRRPILDGRLNRLTDSFHRRRCLAFCALELDVAWLYKFALFGHLHSAKHVPILNCSCLERVEQQLRPGVSLHLRQGNAFGALEHGLGHLLERLRHDWLLPIIRITWWNMRVLPKHRYKSLSNNWSYAIIDIYLRGMLPWSNSYLRTVNDK